MPPSLLYLRRLTRPSDRATPAPSKRWAGASPEFWDRWTPNWAVTDGGIFLDLTGTERLWGDGPDGSVRVCQEASRFWGPLVGGAAPARLPAVLAASFARSWAGQSESGALFWLRPGQVAAFLAPFPITVLRTRYPMAVRTLARYGVRTLGDLQAVSEPLLTATLGDEGRRLADEAFGVVRRDEFVCDPDERLLAVARLKRPLQGPRLESALRRALAVRALAACPEGPGACESTCLEFVWGGDASQRVARRGRGEATLMAWQRRIDSLWRRMSVKRRGLMEVRLWAGPLLSSRSEQGVLFTADRREGALSRAWRKTQGGSSRELFWASEILLARWGVVWSDSILQAGPGVS
jgi:hypothetical protein